MVSLLRPTYDYTMNQTPHYRCLAGCIDQRFYKRMDPFLEQERVIVELPRKAKQMESGLQQPENKVEPVAVWAEP
jgi:hypothetical protein